MSTELIVSPAPELTLAPIFAPNPKDAKRTLEFHPRKANLNATRRVAQWCDEKGIRQLTDVQAFHVAAFVKHLRGEFSSPTVKQHLAGLRMLFDWLVTGHVLETNPAHAARGPKYVMKKRKTPVLNTDEARALLNAIDTSSVIVAQDACRMIQRRAKAAGIEPKIGNHTFRATVITAYMKNGGKLETADCEP